VLLNGLSVVIELLRRYARDTTEETATLETLPPLLAASVSKLEQFDTFLKTPMPTDMITTVGQLNPLGFYRLKVVDFYLSLLRTRYVCEVLLPLPFCRVFIGVSDTGVSIMRLHNTGH
jgi:hypothetical protein